MRMTSDISKQSTDLSLDSHSNTCVTGVACQVLYATGVVSEGCSQWAYCWHCAASSRTSLERHVARLSRLLASQEGLLHGVSSYRYTRYITRTVDV